MIRTYDANETDFSHNGNRVIQATKAEVKEEDNGAFNLELKCPAEYANAIENNTIITVDTPRGVQAFRVRNLTKTGRQLAVKATHIFYDSENYLIENAYAFAKTAGEALNYFNSNTDSTSPFTMSSDITTINNLREVRASLNECVNDVIGRWGGHLIRDNWNISVNQYNGNDYGVTIEYAKNLQELTASYNWDNVVTKLLPVGKDEQLLDDVYITSAIDYGIPYTKSVNFSQDIEESDYRTHAEYITALKADLEAQARAYLNINQYPQVNYKLKANAEHIHGVGDIISVKDRRIGVDLLTQVISYKYNCLTGKFTELEFGNFTPTLGDLMQSVREVSTATANAVTANVTADVDGLITAVNALNISKQDVLTAGALINLNSNVVACTLSAGNGLNIDGNGKININKLGTWTFYGYKAVGVSNGVLTAYFNTPAEIDALTLTRADLSIYTAYGADTKTDISSATAGTVSNALRVDDRNFKITVADANITMADGVYIALVDLTINGSF